MLCDYLKLEDDADKFDLIRKGYLFALSRHKVEIYAYSLRMGWVCELLEKSKLNLNDVNKIYDLSSEYVKVEDYNRFIKYFTYQTCSLAEYLCDEFNCHDKMDEYYNKFKSLINHYEEDINTDKVYLGE